MFDARYVASRHLEVCHSKNLWMTPFLFLNHKRGHSTVHAIVNDIEYLLPAITYSRHILEPDDITMVLQVRSQLGKLPAALNLILLTPECMEVLPYETVGPLVIWLGSATIENPSCSLMSQFVEAITEECPLDLLKVRDAMKRKADPWQFAFNGLKEFYDLDVTRVEEYSSAN